MKKFVFSMMMALLLSMPSYAQKANVTQGKAFTVNGVEFYMVEVPAGAFRMSPEYTVALDSYLIGQTEVTQELWEAVMGSNPSDSQGPKRPVESVSWKDCQKFIEKLNELTGAQFRLPTEAEWTYAAIGGKRSHGFVYSGSNKIDDVAWWADNVEAYVNFIKEKGNVTQIHGKVTRSKLQDVATRLPNELGIYDMTGNVSEWCQDWHKESFPTKHVKNPQGPAKGKIKSIRGGSFKSTSETSAISYRNYGMPNGRYEDVGLRLALTKE